MKNVIIFIVLALILSAVTGVIVYMWLNFNINNLQIQKQSLESQINTLQNQVSENDKKNSDLQAQLNSLINKPVANVTSNNRIYGEGQPYKFQLTIPDDWQDVIVTEEKQVGNLDKKEIGYKFSLIAPNTKEKIAMFLINIYKTSVWQEVKNQMPNNEQIYSDSDYTYSKSVSLDWDKNWGFPDTLTPYPTIIDTFKKL
jgi:hypothetical protein